MSRILKKTGTMQQAAAEGESYLKRSWGDDKYKRVQEIIGTASEPEKSKIDNSNENESSPKKAKLSKHSTMIATAKESELLLKDTKIDTDAKTRHQANEINKLIPAKEKKPKLSKNSTMVATAKESETLLKSANIDEDAKTRNQSKAINNLKTPAPKLKKNSTMTATTKEALDFMTRQPLASSRKASAVKVKTSAKKTKKVNPKNKKNGVKKATLKKSGTMERTAKEGKAYVKRLDKKSK